METLEKTLDLQAVKERILKNYMDLSESASFKWTEDISNKDEYKLVIENKERGTLNIRNSFKKTAVCNIFNKRYSMLKKGIFEPRIIIYEDNIKDPIATFYYGTWKGDGELIMADGNKYLWKLYDRLNNEWIYCDKYDNELFHFKPRTSFYKSGYNINIKNNNIDLGTIAVIMMAGIFNLITSDEEVSLDAGII